MQLHVHKCSECGQPLPESYEPPADEPWSSGIFGCTEDTQSCKFPNLLLFCVFCFLRDDNVESLKEMLFISYILALELLLSVFQVGPAFSAHVSYSDVMWRV